MRTYVLWCLILIFVGIGGGCGAQRPGPESINVRVSNESDIYIKRCEVKFGPNNIMIMGNHMPGTSSTYLDFLVKQLSVVDVKVEFDGGDTIDHTFSVAFLNEVEARRVELEFIVDRESNSIRLVALSLPGGGEEVLLKTIDGEDKDS